MDQFKKNVLFVTIAVSTVMAVAFSVNYVLQAHTRRMEEQKLAWRKANIKALKDLSVIGALSTEEQTRVDNAGDDVDRLQQVLIDLHQERLSYWTHQAKELEDKERSLQQQWNVYQTYASYPEGPEFSQVAAKLRESKFEALNNVAAYLRTKETIHSWTSMRRPVRVK